MCTLTWYGEKDGYRIFFNRDERRERSPATPPTIRRHGRTRFIAPTDGDFGGTWIAVNDRGISLCLLNGFPGSDDAPLPDDVDYVSRGELPPALIGATSIREIVAALDARDLTRFRPFVLAGLAPAGDGFLARWSGRALDRTDGAPAEMPLISSSFFTEEVRESRRSVFAALRQAAPEPAAELHARFHRSHDPERGPYSPCMHRPDAHTVSFSNIVVGPREIRFGYSGASPCRDEPLTTVTLERR